MATLLLRCAGPMQSWGVSSRFEVRDTAQEPTKSGVIGLLCAALGRARSEPIDDLAAMTMAVRVDQAGRVERDYHTAGSSGHVMKTGALKLDSILSSRYYLADAAFLVGLEGELELMTNLHNALRQPHWSLFLGRKAFVPSPPPWLPDGLHDVGLEDALRDYPWIGTSHRGYQKLKEQGFVRIVVEDPAGSDLRYDQPISFDSREFAVRTVTHKHSDVPRPPLDWPEEKA